MIPLGNKTFTYRMSSDGSTTVGGIIVASSLQPGVWRNGWTSLNSATGRGLACSADGSVVVGEYSSPSTQAFRWTSAGGFIGLGDLSTPLVSSQAIGVSPDGSIVVGQGTSASGKEAFRWTQNTGMEPLGDLPGGSFKSFARAVTNDGSVIIGDSESSLGFEAIVWTPTAGMRRLWDVMLDQGIDPSASGWSVLTTISDMTPDGRTVVGYGMQNGR
jgi:probable HAF family extracellular repeat protein